MLEDLLKNVMKPDRFDDDGICTSLSVYERTLLKYVTYQLEKGHRLAFITDDAIDKFPVLGESDVVLFQGYPIVEITSAEHMEDRSNYGFKILSKDEYRDVYPYMPDQ